VCVREEKLEDEKEMKWEMGLRVGFIYQVPYHYILK
jgi:hypothetical protein